MGKPTIVLVPGAWHTPEHMQPFSQRLNEAGYPTVCRQLPSVGSDEPRKQTMAADAEFVRQNVLLPQLDQGKDVVVFLHSYAGFPGGAAVKGLGKKDRNAAGLSGGVIGLIFLTAFVGHEGQSITGLSPNGKLAPYAVPNDETGQIELVGDPATVLFDEATDSSQAKPAVDALKLQSYASFDSPSPAPGWPDEAFDGRRAYAFCHQDKAFPLHIQKLMVSMSGKQDWRELELEDSDHSPYITRIEPLFRFVDELAREWAS